MNVYATCPSCTHQMSFKTAAATKVEFAMRNWEHKKLNCRNCGKSIELSVDDLYALPSRMAQSIAGGVLLMSIPVILAFQVPVLIAGLLLLVPAICYGILTKQESTRVSDFNKRKLKGRVHNVKLSK